MVDKQRIMQQIAQIMINNVGNKITVELANGMLQEIGKLIPESVKDDHDTTTNSDVKE